MRNITHLEEDGTSHGDGDGEVEEVLGGVADRGG